MSKSDENDVFLSLDDDDSKPVETKVKKTKEKAKEKTKPLQPKDSHLDKAPEPMILDAEILDSTIIKQANARVLSCFLVSVSVPSISTATIFGDQFAGSHSIARPILSSSSNFLLDCLDSLTPKARDYL